MKIRIADANAARPSAWLASFTVDDDSLKAKVEYNWTTDDRQALSRGGPGMMGLYLMMCEDCKDHRDIILSLIPECSDDDMALDKWRDKRALLEYIDKESR